MVHDRPPVYRSPSPQADPDNAARLAAEREATRLRAFLVRIADAIDIALDADWRVAIDIPLDLSDEIHAELVP